jgi:Deacetylase PdaC/Protein of unknown function (DUF3298)
MKKNSFVAICAIISLFLASCGKSPAKVTPLTFDTITIRDSTGNCGDGNCFTSDINYIVAKGGDEAITKSINDSLRQSIINDIMVFVSDSLRPSKVEDALQLFRKEYDKQVAEQAKEPEPFRVSYALDLNMTQSYQNAKVVCISQGYYSFSGGAHPNTEERLFVFDLKTAKLINMKDIVKDSVGFMKIVEAQVRKVHEIPANQTLHEFGFLFGEENASLPLPVDYSLNDNKLRIVYNPYEIAAYAFGPTDFEIPLADLDKVLKLDLLK